MGLLSFFRKTQRPEVRAYINAPVTFGREGVGMTPPPLPRYGMSGLNVLGNGGTGMTVSAVYRCVRLLSDTVAGLRMEYQRKKDGVFREFTGSPLSYLLAVQPQPEMSAYNFWSLAVQQMLLHGNAYIYPRLVGNEVTDLVLCRPECVSHDTWNNIYTVSDGQNGVYGRFPAERMIHLYLHTLDGRSGVSVLEFARTTLGAAEAGDKETYDRFANGGNARFFLTSEGGGTLGMNAFSDEELDALSRDMSRRVVNEGDRFTYLPDRVAAKQYTLSSSDMQFLESRKFEVIEICRFFGVPPSFCYGDTSTNYKSAENASSDFLKYGLNPILERIEGELNRKLCTPSEYGRRRFMFNRSDIYAMDLETQARYHLLTLQNGTSTVNELRARMNRPPVDGGDLVYLSTNLAALGSDKLAYGAKDKDIEPTPTQNDEDK